jgi:hypothetical protein
VTRGIDGNLNFLRVDLIDRDPPLPNARHALAHSFGLVESVMSYMLALAALVVMLLIGFAARSRLWPAAKPNRPRLLGSREARARDLRLQANEPEPIANRRRFGKR